MAEVEVIVAIPARHASSRLPGKPLLPIAGKPMILHVIDRARALRGARVVVATDHAGIAQLAQEYGAEVVMTQAEHPTGSDRLAEMARKLALSPDCIVVNLQGDEPQMPLSALEAVVQALRQAPDAAMATLSTPIENAAQLFDPSCVKVVTDARERALYFSRAPIPFARDAFAQSRERLPPSNQFARHLGLYAYRARALQKLASLPQGNLEKLESLEQLRALEHGLAIVVKSAPETLPAGVDTESDLRRVDAAMRVASDGAHVGTAKPVSGIPKLAARKLLFVCMGNICRSPLSHALAQKLARERGWFDVMSIDSAGTVAYTQKATADLRSQMTARALGLDLSKHRARAVEELDFIRFDLIVAHDERNLADLSAMAPPGHSHKLRMLLSFAPGAERSEVPDPYYGDHSDFILAAQLIKQGVEGLFSQLDPFAHEGSGAR
jgi:3-deoxy-manno-octulosonate cytidylyltransferase (CMP-KDO synthetase)